MRHSIEPRYRTYGKGYGFLSFAKNMGKYLSDQYGQKLLESAKKSAKNAIKTASKRATAETTGDLFGKKIADKITSVLKKSPTELHSMELHFEELQNDKMEAPKRR